jgi:biopolymer transport protein ExbD
MGGGAQSDADESINAINVTPLVDITLVLLIIFMVTARLIDNQAVLLDLPKAATGAEVQIVFSIVLAADGSAQVDTHNIPNDDAILALARETHQRNPDVRAVIKADSSVPHGRVIHVLDLLKQAQIAKIAFGVTPISPMAPVSPASPTSAPAPKP